MVAPSMSKRKIQADFLTSSYRIGCEAYVGRMGFSGLLNDDSSLIEVYAATMARAHQPSKPVDGFKTLTLAKSEIVAVCLKRNEDVGPHTLGRTGYDIIDHAIWLTSSSYEIQGVLRWAGHIDVATLLVDVGRAFVPLYDAKLTHTLIPAINFEYPAIFFNRRFIASFAFMKERQKWE